MIELYSRTELYYLGGNWIFCVAFLHLFFAGYNGTSAQLDGQNNFNAGGGSYAVCSVPCILLLIASALCRTFTFYLSVEHILFILSTSYCKQAISNRCGLPFSLFICWSIQGFQTDNGSLLYYLPGYDPYPAGSFMGADGQQPYYSSPGYLQHSVPYGSEAMPCYSWNSAYVGDVTNGTNGYSGKSKSSLGSNASMKSNGFNSTKPTGALASKFSALPLDSKSQKTAAYSNIYKSNVESQPIKTSSKVRV